MRIPRLIHHIWIGPKPFPERFRQYRQTWLDLHRDWDFRFWTERELASLPLRNRECLSRVASESERSDIIRYELLHNFGGVYVDADFECLKTLDALIEPHAMFVGADCIEHGLNTGLFGAVPGHSFLDLVIRVLPRNLDRCRNLGISHANHTVGPWFFSRIVRDTEPRDLHVFPTELFYPYAWHERHTRAGEDFRRTRPDAYAVHHWSFSWETEQRVPDREGFK